MNEARNALVRRMSLDLGEHVISLAQSKLINSKAPEDVERVLDVTAELLGMLLGKAKNPVLASEQPKSEERP